MITKEQSEHFAKYGNITKTIKFPTPPTYEQFLFVWVEEFWVYNFGRLLLDKERDRIIVTLPSEHYDVPNTKENYYKCLDKMIELWRGE